MQPDPDLKPAQNQAVYSQSPQVYSGGGVYAGQGGLIKSNLGMFLMALFAGVNLAFLVLAALYSTGILTNDEASTGGVSYFSYAFMTFVAGGLALVASYIGMRLSDIANSKVFDLVHRILFFGVLGVSAIVLLGPLFN